MGRGGLSPGTPVVFCPLFCLLSYCDTRGLCCFNSKLPAKVLSSLISAVLTAKKMTTRAERYQKFFQTIINLRSIPVVVVYLILIPASLLWKRLVPALGLRKVMVVYNFLCSGLSAYAVFIIGKYFVQNDADSFFKMENSSVIKHAMFVYWVTKNLELLDTVFMILRHKQRQISFLHVYHHSSILLLADLSYHIYPWPPAGFMLGMNSFVHVFLYIYYGQSALFQSQRPSWKKRMTELQILQFFIGLVYCTYGHMYYGFCVYGIFYGFSMVVLFGNFYYQAYVRVKPEQKKQE